MRSAAEIQTLIIDTAKSDPDIRAVLLNGSRANPNITPDKYQDFDIVYLVNNLSRFTDKHRWIQIFGEILICQFPDDMNLTAHPAEKPKPVGLHYLMQFKDGNRIDLTLFPLDKLETDFPTDSLTIVWLDKDQLFTGIARASDVDYLIQKPTQKQFSDTCNEFWWVSLYVAKGLLRSEITYAKEMLETVVRPMFMNMVEWHIGTQTNFAVSFGKGGRFMQQYLPDDQYRDILSTYSDHQIENNWKALLLMTELFAQFTKTVAARLHFSYNLSEEENVSAYLKLCHLY